MIVRGPSQPLPTRYKGYHFRSRLEARWAVFFDTLKIPWEYEAEAYELPSGRYLPDFSVGRLLAWCDPCWVEVKPSIAAPDSKWAELVELTRRDILVYIGPPGPDVESYCAHLGRYSGRVYNYTHRRNKCPFHSFDLRLPIVDAAWRAARAARFEWGDPWRDPRRG